MLTIKSLSNDWRHLSVFVMSVDKFIFCIMCWPPQLELYLSLVSYEWLWGSNGC